MAEKLDLAKYLKIMICRDAADPLQSDYQTGYNCLSCRKGLQVSPFGIAHLAQGYHLFCNHCGFALMLKLQQKIEVISFSPQAAQQVFESFLDGDKS